VLQLYVYRKDGQREETFPRREWGRIKYPHTVRVDAAGRVWAAGLQVWPWEDGVHGPVEKVLNETMTPPVSVWAWAGAGTLGRWGGEGS
jgi:NADPH:quinone reductase-like Zn-dependent oxidoreductase